MPFPILLSISDWRKKSSQHPDQIVESYLREIYDAKTIYERFDSLIKLLEHCDSHVQSHKNYKELGATVLEVIGHIINDNNEATVREKINARIAVREFDPFFIPWSRPNPGDISNEPLALYERVKEKPAEQIKVLFSKFYAQLKKSKNLLPYGGKGASGEAFYRLRSKVATVHHNAEEIEEFRVLPNNTNLLKLQTIDNGDNRHLTFSYATSENLSIKAYDGFAQQPEDFPKTAIYTVHINGGIFMGRSLAPERTSFFSDQAILHPSYGDSYSHVDLFMAGQIKVINGKILMIDGASGHFMPDDKQTSRAVSFFESLGIVNNLTELPYYQPTNKGYERVYTPAKYTWLIASLVDYSIIKKVDFRQITEFYLKEQAPELYTLYTLQSSINNELGIWLEQSAVFYNRPSPHTIRLNNAVENFSRFGKYDQPILNLRLLADIEICINDWNAFHQSEKTTSRRQSAVNMLEIRVMEHMIYNKLYLLLENFSYNQGDPNPYNTIIDNFLQRKIDLKIMIEQVKPLLGRPGLQFFSEKKSNSESIPEEIDSLFRVIAQFEKTSIAAELKEINRQLDMLNEELGQSLLPNLSHSGN